MWFKHIAMFESHLRCWNTLWWLWISTQESRRVVFSFKGKFTWASYCGVFKWHMRENPSSEPSVIKDWDTAIDHSEEFWSLALYCHLISVRKHKVLTCNYQEAKVEHLSLLQCDMVANWPHWNYFGRGNISTSQDVTKAIWSKLSGASFMTWETSNLWGRSTASAFY